MSYGSHPYGGVAYAGSDVADIPADTETTLAVEVSFTTGPLAEPAWIDITPDVRSWNTLRGRQRELERMQPGRATIVLGNLSRQYDSINTAGPWYGNLKPMKRVRIRETFSGVTYPVFDGYVDRWQLDYPGVGKDATATITATDGFKPLARKALPRSVYAHEVTTDAPPIWWRLDEDVARLRDGAVLNWGTGGNTYNATFVGSPRVGARVIVVNDPGSTLQVTDNFSSPGTPIQGAELGNATFSLLSQTTFSTEAWVRLAEAGTTQRLLWTVSRSADAAIHGACGYFDVGGGGATGRFQFLVQNSAFSLFYGVETPSGSVLPGQIHHVVCVVESGGQMAIWLNGTRYTTAVSGATGTSLSGITRPTNGDLQVGFERDSTPDPNRNWGGEISNFAIWPSQLTDARIAAHYAAGTAPWQSDLPGARIGRILDLAGWPAARRELDAGITTFQSAALPPTALEHVQKAADTEYTSLLFIARDGNVRFVGRTAVFAREPYPIAFGPDAGEVGYRNLVPDDGDLEIKNRAIVSRLNGAAQTTEDAGSIDEFGPSDYTADGLLSNSETESKNHANFVVDEYGVQRRRITSVDLGDAVVGQEAVLYPAMLGVELGDAITVRNEPLGGGDPFEQVCGIEGIEHAGTPKGPRTTRLILSPEFAVRALEDEEVSTLGYAQVTANQSGITSIADLTGLSATVTVGSSRRIRVTGHAASWQSNTADGRVVFCVRESSTTLNQTVRAMDPTANNGNSGGQSVWVGTPSAGSHTYKLSALGVDGGESITLEASATSPAFILVEDIGPA